MKKLRCFEFRKPELKYFCRLLMPLFLIFVFIFFILSVSISMISLGMISSWDCFEDYMYWWVEDLCELRLI